MKYLGGPMMIEYCGQFLFQNQPHFPPQNYLLVFLNFHLILIVAILYGRSFYLLSFLDQKHIFIARIICLFVLSRRRDCFHPNFTAHIAFCQVFFPQGLFGRSIDIAIVPRNDLFDIFFDNGPFFAVLKGIRIDSIFEQV